MAERLKAADCETVHGPIGLSRNAPNLAVSAQNLSTTTLSQAFCPYCGHTDDPSDFVTDKQKEYMLSVVGNQ